MINRPSTRRQALGKISTATRGSVFGVTEHIGLIQATPGLERR
jgi:hypothetical protein